MSKFWIFTVILLFSGLVLAFGGDLQEIEFRDLETECRYDNSENQDMTLDDRKLEFEGNFPVENTDAKLGYDYSRSGGDIVLNVKSKDMEQPESFVDGCLGSTIYEARTGELQPGRYDVRLKHEGELRVRKVIRVK